MVWWHRCWFCWFILLLFLLLSASIKNSNAQSTHTHTSNCMQSIELHIQLYVYAEEREIERESICDRNECVPAWNGLHMPSLSPDHRQLPFPSKSSVRQKNDRETDKKKWKRLFSLSIFKLMPFIKFFVHCVSKWDGKAEQEHKQNGGEERKNGLIMISEYKQN